MNKIPIGTIIFALFPFIGMCFTVPLWDRVEPMVLGLPFNLFWLLAWILLTSVCMWAANRILESHSGPKSK